MKSTFFLAFVLLVSSAAANAQTNNRSTEPLVVVPSNFKLLTTNVSYDGEECSARSKDDFDSSKVLRVGNDVYYESHRYGGRLDDGLVAESVAAKTCRLYPMFSLAKAVGWYKPKEDEGGTPDATRGLFRVGNSLWMGSNGIGIAVFDLKRKTWSRIDLKNSVIPGDHLGVDYADNDYAFISRGEFPGASLHIYSVKQDRWLGLKAISTELVREYGYTTGMVQVGIDHRQFAKQKYLPADWTLMYPDVTLIDNGKSYSCEKKFSENKTAFVISGFNLEVQQIVV